MFAPLFEVLATKLREVFPDHDSEGNYIVPTIDFRAQDRSSTYMTAEAELENQFSGLLQLDTNNCSIVIAPGMCAPHISDDALQQIASEACTLAQKRAAHV